MPMVKTKARHVGCSVFHGIQWYLEEKVPGRALARSFCNMHNAQQDEWARAFDHIRMASGNQLPYHGLLAVQWMHFSLSPDPLDDLTQKEVLEYAHDWAAHFFGDGGEPGILGCFQCAIVLHDDNENGVLHAHVIVNNTELATAKRLQISVPKGMDDLANYAQDLARARGWHYFDNTPNHDWIAKEAQLPLSERRAMLPEGSSKSLIERNMEQRDIPVWKNNMRTRIGVAKNVSQTEADFLDACTQLGIKAHFKEPAQDYLFAETEHNGQEHKCMGRGLGKDYFGRGVEGRRTLAMQMPVKDAAKLRENVLRAMAGAQTHSVSVPGNSGVSQRQIAVALATMRKWSVTNESTLSKALSRCGRSIGKTSGDVKKRNQKEYSRLKNVEKLSGKIGLFNDIGADATRAARIRELEAIKAAGVADAKTDEELTHLRIEENATLPARHVPNLGAGGFFGNPGSNDDEDSGHGANIGAPAPTHRK